MAALIRIVSSDGSFFERRAPDDWDARLSAANKRRPH
jgi:hypothetical protein